MPAVNFTVSWPDGDVVDYYCPSSVIFQHLKKDQRFSVAEFANTANTLLEQASERVKEKFGFYCSAASGEQQKIARKIHALTQQKIDGEVRILSLS